MAPQISFGVNIALTVFFQCTLRGSEIVPKAVHEAPAAAERVPASPELSGIPDTPLPEVGPVRVWQAPLDVSVWRSRPWWLRVAASLVVKRLKPLIGPYFVWRL